jgi:uncharacterized membrane protein
MLPSLLLTAHLLAATFWVGGMAVMHFAVRPAALATLEPPLRLPFMAAALSRFFAGVGLAIVVLLASGLTMIVQHGGFAAVHWSVHAMAGVGVLMMVLFGHIRFAGHPRLLRHVAGREWPQAGAALNRIRRFVEINLVLGVAVFVLVVAGPSLHTP